MHEVGVAYVYLLRLGEVVQLPPLGINQREKSRALKRLEHLEPLVASGFQLAVERAHVRRLRTALCKHHQHLAGLPDRILRDVVNRGIVRFKHLVNRLDKAFSELCMALAVERIVSAFQIRLEIRQHLQLLVYPPCYGDMV